jgi:hypothetical protein
MGRRSKNESMPEMLVEILEFVFQHIPPWISIPLAGVGFFLIVLLWDAQVKFPPLHAVGVMFGAIFAVACLIAGWNGFRFRQRQQAFLRANIDMQWVRGLSWQDFERQMADVYRQKGYQVEETGGGGADGRHVAGRALRRAGRVKWRGHHAAGWRVVRIWECDLAKRPETCVRRIQQALG